MFAQLTAWYQERQQRREADKREKHYLDGMRSLACWRDRHSEFRQERGYAEVYAAIDRALAIWPRKLEWDN